MKIYAVADMHGKPHRIYDIEENISTVRPDVLVAAGDITNFVRVGLTLKRLDALPVPVLAVRGNTDMPHMQRLFNRFSNITALHLNPTVIGGTRFTGLSGTALLPFRSRIRYRERRIFKSLEPQLDTRTVLVAHPPPWGVLDEVLGRFHAGCHRLLRIVRSHRPALVLFGHIHERAGTATIGDTMAVNCSMGRGGGGAVIHMERGRVAKVEMI